MYCMSPRFVIKNSSKKKLQIIEIVIYIKVVKTTLISLDW